MELVIINGIEYKKIIDGDKISYLTTSNLRIKEKVEKFDNKSYLYECTIHKIEEGKGRTESWTSTAFASTNNDSYTLNEVRYKTAKEAGISLKDFSFALGIHIDPYRSDSGSYLKVMESMNSNHDNSRGYLGDTKISSKIIRVTVYPNGESSEEVLSDQSERLSNGPKKREIQEYRDKINNSLKFLRFAAIVQSGISLEDFKNAIYEREPLRNPNDSKYFRIADQIRDFKGLELTGHVHVNTASSTRPSTPKTLTEVAQTVQIRQPEQTVLKPATPKTLTEVAQTVQTPQVKQAVVVSPTKEITMLSLTQEILIKPFVKNKILLVLILMLIGSVSNCSSYILWDKHLELHKYLGKSQILPSVNPQKSN